MFKDLVNKVFRHAFVEENVKARLAFQIRALREKAGLSQPQLAQLTGNTQSAISRIEDPTYGRLTLRTLLKLGVAFDVALYVGYVPFTKLISEIADVSPSALAVANYMEEKQAMQEASALSESTAPVGQTSVVGFGGTGSALVKAFETRSTSAMDLADAQSPQRSGGTVPWDISDLDKYRNPPMQSAPTLAQYTQIHGVMP